ncbi:hypothetical protein F5Y05DRAFT_22039 [Hypoxylon sp. FL0543]|nr:hypothetical protein F5Y05DRAFT_22039 [Hypoxylon sp. FL0543]
MASSPQSTLLLPDWVFSFSSDAHCCADKGWFSEYTPFASEATDYLNNKIQILGVGTVDLPVKRSPFARGRHSHNVLHLTDVLHVPQCQVNIIGQPILQRHPNITIDYGRERYQGSIVDPKGRYITYMKLNEKKLLAFQISGYPVGPKLGESKLKPDVDYTPSVTWPARERCRWEDFQAAKSSHGEQDVPAPSPALVLSQPSPQEPYTASIEDYSLSKRQWLKDHHPEAHEFLVNNGLNIFKDEHREMGHTLLRALMGTEDEQDDGSEGHSYNDEEEEYDDESNSDFQEYLRLEGRDVEQIFSDAELDFIEERFGSAEEFMAMHRLSRYNDHDCDRATRIVQILMPKRQ